MYEKGKKRLLWEIEKFVVTRLRPLGEYPYFYLDELSMEERFWRMDKWWKWREEYRYKKSWGELVGFPQLTNHEICHEMFWNAFRGRSKMYIQIKDLRNDEGSFSFQSEEGANDRETITLQCSLLTTQMLDYDVMMFRAMSDLEDEEYSEAARRFYRPYLFSYVTDINREDYEKLRELQERMEGTSSDNEEGRSPYLWLACTFDPNMDDSNIALEGYVVQSASNITKIKTELYLLEEDTHIALTNDISGGYDVRSSCIKDNPSFMHEIRGKFDNDRLSTIDVYKIGNGNCVYAQGTSGNMSFFYDIGFNYRHRPQKIVHGASYSYIGAMNQIYAKSPSFFILSHWDMDHIAGGVAARKDFLDKDWFAPDCYDACVDAKRLAKYLDMNNHLYLAKRHPKKGTSPGRLIGEINITDAAASPQTIAIYRLYMGKKASCDSSYANCEGIVIEYTDIIKSKTVLMMGDVNYASFDKARSVVNHPSFAATQIDYLIAPHHGSDHTGHDRITNGSSAPIQGTMAVICCTNEIANNRPNKDHKGELQKRFGSNVYTTEEDPQKKYSITIQL